MIFEVNPGASCRALGPQRNHGNLLPASPRALGLPLPSPPPLKPKLSTTLRISVNISIQNRPPPSRSPLELVEAPWFATVRHTTFVRPPIASPPIATCAAAQVRTARSEYLLAHGSLGVGARKGWRCGKSMERRCLHWLPEESSTHSMLMTFGGPSF